MFIPFYSGVYMLYAEILGNYPTSPTDIGTPSDSGQLLFEGSSPVGPVQATGQFFIPLSSSLVQSGFGYNRFSFTGTVVLDSQTAYDVQLKYSSFFGAADLTATATIEIWLVGR
jgi:hypothetical protein